MFTFYLFQFVSFALLSFPLSFHFISFALLSFPLLCLGLRDYSVDGLRDCCFVHWV